MAISSIRCGSSSPAPGNSTAACSPILSVSATASTACSSKLPTRPGSRRGSHDARGLAAPECWRAKSSAREKAGVYLMRRRRELRRAPRLVEAEIADDFGHPRSRRHKNRRLLPIPDVSCLPVDLGPHYENLRMNLVNIRPVEGRCQLKHIHPVCHEADPDVGIPV